MNLLIYSPGLAAFLGHHNGGGIMLVQCFIHFTGKGPLHRNNIALFHTQFTAFLHIVETRKHTGNETNIRITEQMLGENLQRFASSR
ncbi:hypothetical protein D3C76_1453280 [compost metagenome]